MKDLVAVILAAGKSKRMKTRTPKIIHPIMGKPMIDYVLEAIDGAGIEEKILVIGHGREKIKDYLQDRVKYAVQEKQLGTGHAVIQAMELLEGFSGDVLILCGDMPLLKKETLSDFISKHREGQFKISLLTAKMDNPGSLGRVVRDRDGNLLEIVEAADATPEQLSIREVNTGTYLFKASYLREILPALGRPNVQNEIYLTDAIEISRERSFKIGSATCADFRESLGVNNRANLAEASAVVRERINHKLMLGGVTIFDPLNTYIEAEVEISNDTTILPGCMITGKTRIGSDCIIGPNTRIENSVVGNGAIIRESVILESEVGEETVVGPFAHMRPGSKTGRNVKIGNFVETKKSSIGDNSKIPHLSYVGDSQVGRRVNVGAGTITCNYDGVRKHPTTIKDDAFIGSNSCLVAPVTVGEGAASGAGSVVTKDIPDYKLAVGMPARAIKTLKKRHKETSGRS